MGEPGPPVRLVDTGRQPFEVAFLAASAAVGAILLTAPTRPASVRAAMPAVVQNLWSWGLLTAGLLGLVALAAQGRWLWRGLLAEAAAMVAAGTATAMYVVALAVVQGERALVAGAFVAAFGVGSWVRLARIIRDLR